MHKMVNLVQGYGRGVRAINYSIRRNNSDVCDCLQSIKYYHLRPKGSNFSVGLIVHLTETVNWSLLVTMKNCCPFCPTVWLFFWLFDVCPLCFVSCDKFLFIAMWWVFCPLPSKGQCVVFRYSKINQVNNMCINIYVERGSESAPFLFLAAEIIPLDSTCPEVL